MNRKLYQKQKIIMQYSGEDELNMTWFLISNETVDAIKDALTVEGRHQLDTGLHKTDAIPGDFNKLSCPTCGFSVEEINRNGLYIAARCDWCNEVVHIEKE